VTYLIPGSGSRAGLAGQHSDHPYALLAQMGVKTVVPSTPSDIYGLLRTAIRDDDPVAVFGPATSLGVREEVDLDELPLIPLGKARIHREGSDITVVAVGHLVQWADKVAERMASEVSLEVFDPRSIYPFDWDALGASLEKTGRLVVFDDTPRTCGFAAEVVATAAERFDLKTRPRRITRADIAVPFAPILEREVLPTQEALERVVREVLAES
jgi:pyruvate dehydrogenase E1 component beta subunit